MGAINIETSFDEFRKLRGGLIIYIIETTWKFDHYFKIIYMYTCKRPYYFG